MSEETVTEEVVQTDPQEEIARASGWVGKEEWVEQGKDPAEWRSAEVFNVRGEFFDKLHRQRREMEEIYAAMNDLKELNNSLIKNEKSKVLDDLKKAKVAAFEEQDFNKVAEIDDQINKAYKEEGTTSKPTIQGPSPEQQAAFQRDLDAWISNNSWYKTDADMAAWTDSMAFRMVNEGRSIPDIFNQLSMRVKQAFPHKFTNPNKDKEQTVTSTTRSGKPQQKKTSKYSFNDLNEEQQRVAKRFERMKVMTVDDYIAELAKTGDLG